jgi:hypothetical protein
MIHVVHPGSKGQKGTGSRIRLHNTMYCTNEVYPFVKEHKSLSICGAKVFTSVSDPDSLSPDLDPIFYAEYQFNPDPEF